MEATHTHQLLEELHRWEQEYRAARPLLNSDDLYPLWTKVQWLAQKLMLDQATQERPGLQQIYDGLRSWEEQYGTLRGQLGNEDLYPLWMAIYRLSRTLTADYTDTCRTATRALVGRADAR